MQGVQEFIYTWLSLYLILNLTMWDTRIITYHHAMQPMSMTAHSSDIAFSFWWLHSPIINFNLSFRLPIWDPTTKPQLIWSHSQWVTFDYLMWLLALIPNVINSWVELTLKNRLARGGCPKTYKHMVKLILNPFRTLGS